ncbi:hypothetical protein G6F50_018240 [Rhizopus delemar]|uniref:Uncharacterized protein n=1 Tax=Rhizopus delemar TaxID=936053 RepID=A0A9P6XMS7_9FUNG|nr:hypothetical protein G6F50_018240 [Rhizopus delemar]
MHDARCDVAPHGVRPQPGAGLLERMQERRFSSVPRVDRIEPLSAQGHQHDGCQAYQPHHRASIAEISLDQ